MVLGSSRLCDDVREGDWPAVKRGLGSIRCQSFELVMTV